MFFTLKIKFFQLWKKYVLNAFKHEREGWHIGKLTAAIRESNEHLYLTITLDEIEGRLIDDDWQPNYFSFSDEGQITSMRKMFRDNEGYWWQDHIRVHDDGEVRGHREVSYEEDALGHLQGTKAIELPPSEQKRIMQILTA